MNPSAHLARRAALLGLLGLAVTLPAWSANAPAVLSQAARLTPKALGAATLAVTRAGKRLVAVGERGTVLLSDDNGVSWRQASVPVQAT
ncbi:MAG: glycosyl hydrolase, partial [Pseudomonadota bacterium]